MSEHDAQQHKPSTHAAGSAWSVSPRTSLHTMLALIVDGLNLVRRIYAAVPEQDDAAQHQRDVLRSIGRSVERAIETMAPSHALCAFDAPGPNWRHAVLSSYKKGRPAMPAPLTALLPRIEESFNRLGVRTVRVAGFEADDVVATVASKIAARSGTAVILSTDKSMLSLLRDGIRVRNHFEERELDARYTRERFGVSPNQLPSYLALVGERSQNIPGVKSVGAKTAARLIAEYGSLQAVLAAAPDIPGRVGVALRAGAGDALLSLELVTLRTDVDVGLNLNECRLPSPR